MRARCEDSACKRRSCRLASPTAAPGLRPLLSSPLLLPVSEGVWAPRPAGGVLGQPPAGEAYTRLLAPSLFPPCRPPGRAICAPPGPPQTNPDWPFTLPAVIPEPARSVFPLCSLCVPSSNPSVFVISPCCFHVVASPAGGGTVPILRLGRRIATSESHARSLQGDKGHTHFIGF